MSQYNDAENNISKEFHHDEGLSGVCPGTGCELFNRLKNYFMASASKQRFKNDPAYARVRENVSENVRSIKAGKLLLDTVRSLSFIASDKQVSQRMTAVMREVIVADRLSDRGMRTITSDGVVLLRGFDFNNDAKLTSVFFFAPFTAAIDRAAGSAIVGVQSFIPNRMMKRPDGATHFALVAGACEIDFVTGAKSIVTSESTATAIGGRRSRLLP